MWISSKDSLSQVLASRFKTAAILIAGEIYINPVLAIRCDSVAHQNLATSGVGMESAMVAQVSLRLAILSSE